MSSKASWSVPSNLSRALAALVHRRASVVQAKANSLHEMGEQLLLAETLDGDSSDSVPVQVDLVTGGELFQVVCDLCVQLDAENSEREDEIAELKGRRSHGGTQTQGNVNTSPRQLTPSTSTKPELDDIRRMAPSATNSTSTSLGGSSFDTSDTRGSDMEVGSPLLGPKILGRVGSISFAGEVCAARPRSGMSPAPADRTNASGDSMSRMNAAPSVNSAPASRAPSRPPLTSHGSFAEGTISTRPSSRTSTAHFLSPSRRSIESQSDIFGRRPSGRTNAGHTPYRKSSRSRSPIERRNPKDAGWDTWRPEDSPRQRHDHKSSSRRSRSPESHRSSRFPPPSTSHGNNSRSSRTRYYSPARPEERKNHAASTSGTQTSHGNVQSSRRPTRFSSPRRPLDVDLDVPADKPRSLQDRLTSPSPSDRGGHAGGPSSNGHPLR